MKRARCCGTSNRNIVGPPPPFTISAAPQPKYFTRILTNIPSCPDFDRSTFNSYNILQFYSIHTISNPNKPPLFHGPTNATKYQTISSPIPPSISPRQS
jgi:hypothetical protein